MVWEIPVNIVLPIYFLAAVIGVALIVKLSKNKTRKISNLRFYIQIFAVIAIFMGLIVGPFEQPLWAPLGVSPRDRLLGADLLGNQMPDGITFPVLACYYPNGRTVTCPVWQLQAYIFPFWNYPRGYEVTYSTLGIEKIGIVVGSLVVAALVFGRGYCGWLCPFGLFQDVLTRIRKATKLQHRSFSESTSKKLSQSRYIIIAIFLILSVIFGSYYIFGTELIPGTIAGGPGGTEAGIVSSINEPYCLICPMRPFCSLVQAGIGSMNFEYISQIVYGPFGIIGGYYSSISLTVLIIVIILTIAYRRFWCRVCPVGALTGLFSTFTPFKQIALTKLDKDEHKCTKCGVCKRVCPTQATAVYTKKGGDVMESKCILCARCVELCPHDDALKIKFAGKTVVSSRNWLEEENKKEKTD
ncbi:MAG: 4Fe-4S binding protein [Nitrososphaerota archaeon]|jgi:polyferredoxin|nr:4Fe-4S binding protein [Nitrososphaerota archaeon]